MIYLLSLSCIHIHLRPSLSPLPSPIQCCLGFAAYAMLDSAPVGAAAAAADDGEICVDLACHFLIFFVTQGEARNHEKIASKHHNGPPSMWPRFDRRWIHGEIA